MNSPISPISEDNHFERFWHLGFTRLVPIVPPDAEVSDRSSLNKRIGTSQDPRGKAPGIRGRDGKWFGFDWIPYHADQSDLQRWKLMGAGVGIKTGEGLIAIDADTLDETSARIIRDLVKAKLGLVPIRVGRYPKALYLCRVTDLMRYTRVEFGTRNEKKQLSCRVEILSDGRQFVAHGIHPVTGNAYYWLQEIVACDELPLFTPEQILRLMELLREALPAASEIITEGATSAPSPETLKGDLETVRKAVAATPNTSEAFPSRESYLHVGYAIKAALPDHPDVAFRLFEDWCGRWANGTNEPEVIAADWRRMKGPFKRGASWLYELAEQHGDGQLFNRADQWFAPIEEETSPFDKLPLRQVSEPSVTLQPLEWKDPTAWKGMPLAKREWVVDGMIPRGEVTLLYGDGGVGKSLLAHQLATCAATGLNFLGQPTQRSRVMCFLCEDSIEELHRRQTDINRSVGIDFDALVDLRIVSRKHEENLFISWDRSTGMMKLLPLWHQLVRDAEEFRADLLIVDTIADVYSGSEIDRAQVNAFVKAALGKAAQRINGSVMALGHPSQSGKKSGDGTSGSTAWSNAVRSRLYLQYPEKTNRGDIRELRGMKLNYGPPGVLFKLRWSKGAFELIAGSRPSSEDGAAAVGVMKSTGDAAQAAVISVLLSNPTERLALARNSQYFAPRVLKMLDSEMLDPFTPDEVRTALEALIRLGAIKPAEVGRDASSRPVFGFAVITDKLTSHAESKTDKLSEITEGAGSVFS